MASITASVDCARAKFLNFLLAPQRKMAISDSPFGKIIGWLTRATPDYSAKIDFFQWLETRSKTMPLYESTFITRQDLSRQDITKITDSFTAIVEQGGGKIVKNEYWGLRNLAYRIRKNRKGHYAMLAIDAPVAAVKEMERNMGINEDIIRSLTVRVETIEEGPTAMMQQSRSRDDYVADGADVPEVAAIAAEETLN